MRVKVINGAATTAQVYLDGVDVSQAISGYSLDHYANRPATLVLELPIVDRSEFDEEVEEVFMPAPTRELLIRLGWSPPQSDPSKESAHE